MNKTDDDFFEFEVEIPMLIEDLQEQVSQSVGYSQIAVDFELASVDTIEKYYLDAVMGEEKLSCSLNHLHRVILAYLGEVLIHHAGGRWELGTESDFTFGTPMVHGFKDDDGIGFSPVGIRDRLINEKELGGFADSLNYAIHKKSIEADLMQQMINLSET